MKYIITFLVIALAVVEGRDVTFKGKFYSNQTLEDFGGKWEGAFKTCDDKVKYEPKGEISDAKLAILQKNWNYNGTDRFSEQDRQFLKLIQCVDKESILFAPYRKQEHEHYFYKHCDIKTGPCGEETDDMDEYEIMARELCLKDCVCGEDMKHCESSDGSGHKARESEHKAGGSVHKGSSRPSVASARNAPSARLIRFLAHGK